MGNKWLNSIAAVIVGTMLAVGSVGCLVSGFDLTIEQLPMIVMIAGLFSLMGAIAFSYRYGFAAVLGISLMAALFFWAGGEAQTQTQAMITHITYVYDQAYHWGVLRFPGGWYGVKADLPMSIAASVIALAVTWVICRRRSAVWAIIPALIPVVLCFVVTDTVPNAWCFFAVVVGLLFLLLTSAARKRDFERIPSLTVLSSVAIVAAVGVLFAAVPQSDYHNPHESIQNQLLEALGFEGYGSGGTGGEVEGVDLQGLGSRFFLQYPVMTVTSSQDGVLYLRERDFNVYNGFSWESNEEREDVLAASTGDATYDLTVETRWVRRQLLMPYYVTENVPMTDGAAPNTEQTQTYSWQVETLPDNWKAQIPNISQEVFNRATINPEYYHSLPVETQAWAQELLKTILTDEQSATAKADAIAAYVHDMALYEDDCERMPSSRKDFARWFVEEGKSGYCVHFATSTAVLLRAAGVNTRYVTGYMTPVKANEETVITADLEHAWVEYFEPAIGRWVMLESTPPEPEKTETTTTVTVVTTTTTANDATTTTRPTQPTQPDEVKPTIPWRDIFAVIGKVLLWVLGAAAVVALIKGQRRWRQARWEKRFNQGTPNVRALMLWREIERIGQSLGTSPSETALTLAQKAKYSQHTLSDEELKTLSDEREALIDKLRTHAASKRLLYRYVWRFY